MSAQPACQLAVLGKGPAFTRATALRWFGFARVIWPKPASSAPRAWSGRSTGVRSSRTGAYLTSPTSSGVPGIDRTTPGSRCAVSSRQATRSSARRRPRSARLVCRWAPVPAPDSLVAGWRSRRGRQAHRPPHRTGTANEPLPNYGERRRRRALVSDQLKDPIPEVFQSM